MKCKKLWDSVGRGIWAHVAHDVAVFVVRHQCVWIVLQARPRGSTYRLIGTAHGAFAIGEFHLLGVPQ